MFYTSDLVNLRIITFYSSKYETYTYITSAVFGTPMTHCMLGCSCSARISNQHTPALPSLHVAHPGTDPHAVVLQQPASHWQPWTQPEDMQMHIIWVWSHISEHERARWQEVDLDMYEAGYQQENHTTRSNCTPAAFTRRTGNQSITASMKSA
jgi:hypothetical protein